MTDDLKAEIDRLREDLRQTRAALTEAVAGRLAAEMGVKNLEEERARFYSLMRNLLREEQTDE